MADDHKGAHGSTAHKDFTVEKAAEKPAAPAEEKPRRTMLRVKCTDKVVGSGLYDGDNKVRIPKNEDGVKVEGPVRKGSWLESQMDAGLIVEVKD